VLPGKTNWRLPDVQARASVEGRLGPGHVTLASTLGTFGPRYRARRRSS
jgi:hypothetical protein